jgi:hypothetical protein
MMLRMTRPGLEPGPLAGVVLEAPAQGQGGCGIVRSVVHLGGRFAP